MGNEISQVRSDDERKSKLSTQFLEEWFYKPNCDKYEIVTDFERQVQGIDSEFQLGGFIYKCDEKAATDYINSDRGPLGTFSLELSSLNRYGTDLRLGWFLNHDCKNDSYLFLWIDNADNKRLTDISEIRDAEMALVQKVKIWQYLVSKGQDYSTILIRENEIRKNGSLFEGNVFRDGYKYCFSKQKAEKPINILIPRQELVRMADFTKKYHKESQLNVVNRYAI